MALAIIRQPKRVVPVQSASSTRSTCRIQPVKKSSIFRICTTLLSEKRLILRPLRTPYQDIVYHKKFFL